MSIRSRWLYAVVTLLVLGQFTANSTRYIVKKSTGFSVLNEIENDENLKINNTTTPAKGVTTESKADINLDKTNPSIINNGNYFISQDKTTQWKLVWKDDFNGCEGCLPSSENWLFDIGHSYPNGPPNWGNNEAQYYTSDPENVSTDGKGNLRITPLRDTYGNWTSARIETVRTDFKPNPQGKMAIEGRIRMPDVTGEAALGYWPAFWALGSPLRGHYYNWPHIGEFDIMENVNGLDSVWGVLHCGYHPKGPCNEPKGLGKRRPCPGSTCQSNFHTYRFEWDNGKDPKEMTWYVDGEQYNKVTSDLIEPESWNDMTDHSGYFILLNIAIGGGFANEFAGYQETPKNSTEPGHSMLIDYVAVYTCDN